MADERVRHFERDASANPETSAQARLLLERIRAGERDRDDVALAAYLGDPIASAAIGQPIASGPMLSRALGLGRFGAPRCATLLAKPLRTLFRALAQSPNPLRNPELVHAGHALADALATWGADPSPGRERAVADARAAIPEIPREPPTFGFLREWQELRQAYLAAVAAGQIPGASHDEAGTHTATALSLCVSAIANVLQAQAQGQLEGHTEREASATQQVWSAVREASALL